MPSSFLISVIFTFLLLLATGSSQLPCPAKPVNTERELKRCLLQNYDKSVRPADESKTIETSFSMHIRHIDLDEHMNTLKIHVWNAMRWVDAHLTWNPGNYRNVRLIQILSDDIWQPDVALMTTNDASMHVGMSTTYCHVTSDGQVYCAPPTTLLGHCSPDLTRWPYDEQTCTLFIGSWTQLASKLNLTLAGSGVSTNNLLVNRAWELRQASARVRTSLMATDAYPSLEYTFVLRRHSAGDVATAVAPALVLSAMTLITFLLEPGCSERLTVSATNVLAHVMYLQYMSWRLTYNGDSAPALVVFYRDSMVLVGGALLVAVVTRRLLRASYPAPEWLRASAAVLLRSAPGQLLLLGRLSARGAVATAESTAQDGATLVAEKDAARGGVEAWRLGDDAWRLAAVFVDRVTLCIYFISFLALFARYLS